MSDGAAVVFGTGPVGTAVAEELHTQGRPVRAVNRGSQTDLPEAVSVIAGDAADPEFTTQAAQGASTVFFCLNPPYHQWPELFPALQDAVITGAAAAGAKVVSMENTYMYAPAHGQPLTEDLPYAATTRKGSVRAAMATSLLAAHYQGMVRATIGRASDFFGPRALVSAAGDRVFSRAVADKSAQVIGDPDLLHTYSYVPDIARGLITLADRDEADGKAWHLPSPRTVTTREFVDAIGTALGHEVKTSATPRLLLRLVGLLQPAVHELFEMMYEFEEPFVVDHSNYAAAFGDDATPLDAAVATTVDWFRERAA